MRFLKGKGLLSLLSIVGTRVLVVASALMGSAMIAFGGYSLYEQIYTRNRAFNSGVQRFENAEQIEAAQDSLKQEIPDYRAWLRVTDTHIDYPVVQGEDDLHYAKYDIYGKTSLTGAVYMSADNDKNLQDNYIVIYGHHMDNGAMFGDLDRFSSSDFLKAHQEGLLITADVTYEITFFAAVKTDAYDENVYTVGNRNLKDLLSFIQANAIARTDADTSGAKKILALSTCADAKTNGRLVLFGMLAKKQPVAPTPEPENTNTPTPIQGGVTPEPVITDNPTPDVTVTPTPELTVTPTPVVTNEPTITASPRPSETAPSPEPDTRQGEKKSWIDRLLEFLTPGGSSYGDKVWALLNLISLVVTIYIFVPLLRLRAKYGRIRKMREINDRAVKTGVPERSLPYNVKRFAKRFRIGVIIEAVLAVTSLIVFLITEKLRYPMVLIDKWTPLMLLLLIGSFAAEFLLTRQRVEEDEEA